MAQHNDIGKKGEDLAAGWLKGKGFTILDRNWRSARCEVDIIAARQGIYHFIEVKSGTGSSYGRPEERVSRKKIGNLMRAAVAWQHRFAQPGKRVQYDVLSVSMLRDKEPEYLLIEDVYV